MAMTSGAKGYRSDINITPLVDVVLVLLIIFMVLTPLLEKELAVRLPEQEKVELATEVPPEQYVLQVKTDGRIFINTEMVAEDRLVERLRGIFANKSYSQKVIFFDADDDAPYHAAVHALDLVRDAQVYTIGMMTEKIAQGAAAPGAPAPAAPPAP